MPVASPIGYSNEQPPGPAMFGPVYNQGGQFYNHMLPGGHMIPGGVVNIASSISIKLTNQNYLIWRAQVGPLLQSQLLMSYVD